MQSDSQPGSILARPSSKFADFLGTLIALVTIILPLVMVNRYSNVVQTLPTAPPPTQRLNR